MLVNIVTGSLQVPSQIGDTKSPEYALLKLHGWRNALDIAVPEGSAITGWRQDPDDPDWALPIVNTMAEIYESNRLAKLAAMDPLTLNSANVYRTVLRRNFGVGSETNRNITRETVEQYFAALAISGTITTQQLADSELLSMTFPVVAEFTGDGTAWSFPWEVLT